MAIRLQLRLFFWHAFLYVLTVGTGIAAAYEYGLKQAGSGVVEPVELSWQTGLIFLIVFVSFSLFLARSHRFSQSLLKVLMVAVIFYGANVSLGVFLASPLNILAALAIIAAYIFWPRVLIHDIAIVLGVAGISALLGLSLTPTAALIILSVLSIYDIIAVYRTGHMIRMAQAMMESGAIFGFLVPLKLSGFLSLRKQAQDTRDFMILGSGDISLPLIFICSLVTVSLQSAVVTSVFTLAGLFVTHLLFVNQEGRHPMAALPPIATATILGYLVSLGL